MSTTTTPKAQEWASLHFESRQRQWNGFLRSFRQLHGRGDRQNVWTVWVEGDRYFTQHGKLGGKMQETSKKGKTKNVGQVNELTPEQDALAEARRLARNKWDFKGYDEFVDEENIDKRGGGLDVEGNRILPSIPHLLSSLPGSFCLYKPQNNIDDCTTLLEKCGRGDVLYGLKRNGLAMWFIVDGNSKVNIYSRRNRIAHKNEEAFEEADGTLSYDNVIPWNNRFPHLVDAVTQLGLPPYTFLACELVSMEGDEKHHFAHVQSVVKSLTPVAVGKQKKKGKLGLYIWDIPFWNGNDWVVHQPVSYRYRVIQEITASLRKRRPDIADYVQPIELMTFHSNKEALEYAKEHNLEGFVVVDPDGVYGDRAWNLEGKPDRPSKFCAKLKPFWEDDFIAMWAPESKHGTYGKGKHEQGKKVTLPNKDRVIHGGVGSVGLFQYNSKHELIYIADCSSGMSYQFQAGLTGKSFPFVCEIKYFGRSYISKGGDTNALSHPVFVRSRIDKGTNECVNDKL